MPRGPHYGKREIYREVRRIRRQQKRYGIIAIIVATLLVFLPGDIIGEGYSDIGAAIIVYVLGFWMFFSKKILLTSTVPGVTWVYDEDPDLHNDPNLEDNVRGR